MGHRRSRGRGTPGPTDLFSAGSSRKARIKDAQLCAAVTETLSLFLAESTDARLLSLFVIDVRPAPDASRLRVCVEAPPEQDLETTLDLLRRIEGALRSEIATAVQRKRAPSLVFEVRPRGAGI